MLVALTFALAYAATNLDNMALFIALAPSFGLLRVGAAFLLTQASVIAAAFGVGTAIDALPLEWIGWFGLVPIALGLRELWKLWGPGAEGGDQPKVLRSSGLAALLVTFGGLSFDSFALTAALLADSTPAVDLQVLLGAFLGLASICTFQRGWNARRTQGDDRGAKTLLHHAVRHDCRRALHHSGLCHGPDLKSQTPAVGGIPFKVRCRDRRSASKV